MNTANFDTNDTKTQEYKFFEVLPTVLATVAAITVVAFGVIPLFTQSHGMQYNTLGENVTLILSLVVLVSAAWQSQRRQTKGLFSCFMSITAITYALAAI